MGENKTHWKKLTNPDYLGSYAFTSGEEKILTIKSISEELVTSSDGKKEQCMVAKFYENEKPLILNKTNCKAITKLYKTPYIEEWNNRKIQLFVDKVRAFGEVVEALRIRPFVPKINTAEANPVCAECKKKVEPYENMTAQQVAQYTYQKYGKVICTDCAKKIAESKHTEDVLSEDNESEENTDENN